MDYRESYESRKEYFLEPEKLRQVGSNAAWSLPFQNAYDWWYIPGDVINSAYTYNYGRSGKVNFRETDSKKFADALIDGVKIDLSFWNYRVAKTAVDKNYSEIAVYVYETNSFFTSELGYKYRYFFIRQEPFLKFYSMLYNETIYEGYKEELVAILEKEHRLLATSSLYWVR